MKISTLSKILSQLKRKHGDIDVTFNELTVSADADSDYAITPIEVMGAYKVINYETNKTKSSVVLGAKRLKGFEITMENELASTVRKKK